MSHVFSRREWLGGAAAVFAGAGLLAGKPAAFKLGVASYSLRKLSRADAIKALQQMQVDCINIKEFHAPIKGTPEEWKQARRDFEGAGIKILGVGNITMNKPDEGEIRRNFDYAKALGAPLIVMAPTRETLPLIERMVKEYNILAAIHNHGPEDKHFPAPKDVLDAVEGMDKRMGLCVDVGHTTRTGTDIVEAIRATGKAGRLHDIHIKDLRDLMDKDSQVAVGEGKMPIAGIFAELKRLGFNRGVMLEYEINADNPVPGMTKSFEHMRKVLAGMKS